MFRGIVVAAMVYVNTGGVGATPYLTHAKWNGLGFSDIVFPSFVFIVGVSMSLWACRHPRVTRHMWTRFYLRAVTLFAIGLGINALYSATLRSWKIGLNGVLQRIALGSVLAAPFARWRAQRVVWVAAAFLMLHTVLLLAVPFPGGTLGDLSRPGATLPAFVDSMVRTGQYSPPPAGQPGTVDPENLVGVLSTAGGMLLGVAAGAILMEKGARAGRVLVPAGIVSLLLGMGLSPWLPVNKRLWTATFVLLTAGIDALALAALHYVIDVRRRQKMAHRIEPLGRNALIIYIGSSVLNGILLLIPLAGGSVYTTIEEGLERTLGPMLGALTFGLSSLALWYAVAWWMARRKIYVRL